MKNVFFLTFFFILIFSVPAFSTEKELDEAISKLRMLMEQKVVTASRKEREINLAASNVTVITSHLIEERGYRNLVEILEDVPGFDFATYDDGGGEYPSHSFNRGIGGDPGNAKLLIMVDGIVQNHISFNWSQGWTNEQILHDLDRIEIVQGPGSVLYGANAFSGIIHFITKRNYKGVYVKPWAGEYNTKGLDLMYGESWNDFNFQIALRSYLSDGDGGKERPDPAGYFSGNVEPDKLEQNYDSFGNYTLNSPNPDGGKPIKNGFNTEKDNKSVRLKFSGPGSEVGFFYWERKDGLGSYVPGYEYDATNSNFIVHHTGYHVYSKSRYGLIPKKINLHSNVWYRVNRQEPDTGFVYFYRFKDMKKSYHSNGAQIGIEEQLDIKLSGDMDLTVGARHMTSRKMEQVVSLNDEQNVRSSATDSSWDEANSGNGLNVTKNYNTFQESEVALYALLEGKASSRINYSVGGRYEYGTDYGKTVNPRLGLIYRLKRFWTSKLLYGSAFRQPSLFEQQDEFRYNPDLEPEKINTYEIENNFIFSGANSSLFDDASVKVNLFHSTLIDTIGTVTDSSRPEGERFENIGESYVRGISTVVDVDITRKLSFYLNHIYTEGKEAHDQWGAIDHLAKNKVNAGLNWLGLNDRLNLNFRVNHVGRRKVPDSNGYFRSHAKGYTKANLALTFKKLFSRLKIEPQLIVKNLFDEKYYGIGRQGGSSVSSDYDAVSNPNPDGFIPAYHPQPGRTWYLNLRIEY